MNQQTHSARARLRRADMAALLRRTGTAALFRHAGVAALLRQASTAVLMATGLWLAAAQAALAQKSEAVEVRGAVKNVLRLSADDLRAFPPEQITTFTQARHGDTGGGGPPSTARGVRLTAVLERAGLAAPGRHDWKATVVLASASDGYRVAFSWPELFNSPLGANVLVLFERDGQPLDDQEGLISLISGGDKNTGPRHVRWLRALDVRTLDP